MKMPKIMMYNEIVLKQNLEVYINLFIKTLPFYPRPLTDKEYYAESLAKAGRMRIVYDLPILVNTFDISKELKNIKVPLLVLHGSDDKTLPLETGLDII